MNVNDIIKKYLDDHGLDGLWNPNGGGFREDLVTALQNGEILFRKRNGPGQTTNAERNRMRGGIDNAKQNE